VAILKFGTLIVGARGQLGGAVLSANQSGPYAKIWTHPKNPRSISQSSVRSTLGGWGSKWRSLTQAQRDSWGAYASDPAQEQINSLGLPFFVSGFAWYVAINTNLVSASESTREDPPTLPRPVAPQSSFFSFESTASASESRIAIAAADDPGVTNFAVMAALGSSLGQLAQPSALWLMGVRPADQILGNGDGRWSFQPELEAVFGDVPVNVPLWATIRIQDTQGQRGPLVAFRSGTQP